MICMDRYLSIHTYHFNVPYAFGLGWKFFYTGMHNYAKYKSPTPVCQIVERYSEATVFVTLMRL